jgi:hypothetical protein
MKMLNEKYKSALKGFKAQGSASHLFEGCDAEAKHIYSIIMTENTSVADMNEAMLEAFLTNEVEGRADYSGRVDHDGLEFVDMGKSVEVYPCVGDSFLEPIIGQTHILSALDAGDMLGQLLKMGQLRLITDTLQSLCQRGDGTLLQTALPTLDDMKTCLSRGLILPKDLVEKVNLWETMGCSVINFDFEELKR